jgi:hypothetical protein
METETKPKEEKKVRKKREVRKLYHLKDFLGCFKGRIFYDEDIFDFAK